MILLFTSLSLTALNVNIPAVLLTGVLTGLGAQFGKMVMHRFRRWLGFR